MPNLILEIIEGEGSLHADVYKFIMSVLNNWIIIEYLYDHSNARDAQVTVSKFTDGKK